MTTFTNTVKCENCGTEYEIKTRYENHEPNLKQIKMRGVWITIKDPKQTKHTCLECSMPFSES